MQLRITRKAISPRFATSIFFISGMILNNMCLEHLFPELPLFTLIDIPDVELMFNKFHPQYVRHLFGLFLSLVVSEAYQSKIHFANLIQQRLFVKVWHVVCRVIVVNIFVIKFIQKMFYVIYPADAYSLSKLFWILQGKVDGMISTQVNSGNNQIVNPVIALYVWNNLIQDKRFVLNMPGNPFGWINVFVQKTFTVHGVDAK